MKKINGFTLIEVIILLIIIGIIASLALPSYTYYIKRARLDAAKAILLEYYSYVQKYYDDHGNYKDSEGNIINLDDLDENYDIEEKSKYFNFGINVKTDQKQNERLTLTARPKEKYQKEENRYLKTNQYGNILTCVDINNEPKCE